MKKIMSQQDVLDYIAKNHKFGLELELMSYRGYLGTIRYDTEDLFWHGKVLLINDLIVYTGYDKQALRDAFESLVDDYIYDLTTTFGDI